MLTRIFNWLVGDASVDGVETALHRRALWVAFVIIAVAHVFYFLLSTLMWFNLPEPMERFLFEYDRPSYGLTFWLPNINNANLWQVLLLPVIIYALALKARGARIPLAVLDLVGCVLVANLVERLLPLTYFSNEIALLLVFGLMFLRGHLSRRTPLWIAAFSLGLWCCLEVMRILSVQGWIQLPTWPDYVPIEYQVFFVLWLPLSIVLPIVLLARPRAPRLRSPAKKGWQLSTVLLLSGLVAVTSSALYYITQLNYFPAGIIRMAIFTLLIALLWLYFTGRGSLELLSFLTFSTAGMLVILSLHSGVVYELPGWAAYGLPLTLASLLALIVATGVPFRRTNLWAALAIVAGSIAAVAWDAGMVARLAERSKYLLWQVDPGVFVKLELSLLAELALFIGALLLAWWFVRPAEMEALLPWLAKMKSNWKAASP